MVRNITYLRVPILVHFVAAGLLEALANRIGLISWWRARVLIAPNPQLRKSAKNDEKAANHDRKQNLVKKIVD